MSLLSAAAGGILLPEEVGPLILQPLRALSTAIRISTEVTTGSSKFRLPVVQLDAAANWLAEAADITETDPTIGEEVVTPLKVGALTKVSNELANDSSPPRRAWSVTVWSGRLPARSISRSSATPPHSVRTGCPR